MKQYPEYKDSGIQWIGKIPKHWNVMCIKYFTKEHKQGYYSDKAYSSFGYKLLRITDIDDFSNIKYSNCPLIDLSQTEFKEFSLKRDDFVFARSGSIGRFGIVKKEENVVFASYLIRFRFKSILKQKYLKYIFLSDFFKQSLLKDLHGGANKNIHAENIKNKYVVVTFNKNEQEYIASYLERQTAQIDELINKKQRLIELLKEQRAAMINRAVTKGLNPNAPMKDSGIEWLGKIPQHWEVKKLKWVINDKLIYGANEATDKTDKSLPRYIRITDFGDDGSLKDDTFKSLPYEIAKDYLLKDGDILFARSGATVGKTFQYKDYKGIACFAGYLIKATPNPNFIVSDFLYLYTKSNAYKNWKDSIFIQATIQNIGADKYQSLIIPLPSVDEQRNIIEVLKKKTKNIDRYISMIDKEIELLKEYRTALISEVVTGKIDVRDSGPEETKSR